MRATNPLLVIWLLGLLLGSALGAGCGAAPQPLHWTLRFATAGGRGMLVLHTRDVQVAERVALKFCNQQRTELLAESENSSREQRDWRAVFPLTPALEKCLIHERKVEVALEAPRPGTGGPQALPLDDWSTERMFERVHVRELQDLEKATAGVKELDNGKYLAALDDWIARHPRSPALEQARKEAARVRAEIETERKEAAERARIAAEQKRAEEERRARVQQAFADCNAAVQAGDAAKAQGALARVKDELVGDGEKDAARRLSVQVQRLQRLAEIRARYAPKLAAKPRKLYAQRRVVLHEVPDPKSTSAIELAEGDEVWALAGAARAMVGVARTSSVDLATLLGGGPKLEQVEGWVEASALTPKDRWSAVRQAREEDERTLYAGRPPADVADLKRLGVVGRVVSPRVQLGLLRKGYAPAETRRLALLLDVGIRAAANPDDPRMPAICAGLAEVVKARRLPDCAAAAKLGAADGNVAAVARDFGQNSAGFASTFGLATQKLAALIMALALAP